VRKYLLDTNIISYYEIISGLQSIDANKRINEFDKFCKLIDIINLNKSSILASCKIYASLKKSGRLIDDIDILIAGIALSNNLVMVTDNTDHFERIAGLKVKNWKN
jgi:tRNA(fMet)-specific endonuclease VapC